MVFQESAVEEAGCFAAFGRTDPCTACFGVAGKKQGIARYFFPRNNFRRASGRFVAVVGEDEPGGGGKVGDGTHCLIFSLLSGTSQNLPTWILD